MVTDKAVKSDNSNLTFVTKPSEALRFLKQQGLKEALIAGGGKLNGSFMKEELVDEIYLDIEPTVFGKGIPLFGDANFESKLQLINIKKLSGNEIQLHYHVLQ